MYLAIILGIGIIAVLGDARRGALMTMGLGAAATVFFWVLASGRHELVGRVGHVEPDLLAQHFRSMTMEEGTPGVESLEWRLKIANQALEHWSGDWRYVVFGEGFGHALVDAYVAAGVPVRQPHNTHLSVLLRFGVVGFIIWVMLQIRFVVSIVRCIRFQPRGSLLHAFGLWFMIFYGVWMMFTSTQPYLEFSHGAVPFYVVMGYVIGLDRKLRQASGSGAPDPEKRNGLAGQAAGCSSDAGGECPPPERAAR
jgi:hypothetical protein